MQLKIFVVVLFVGLSKALKNPCPKTGILHTIQGTCQQPANRCIYPDTRWACDPGYDLSNNRF
ncbi:hypothetical protein PtrM4_148360 [Pyrenophora tritici-repentis]|uniref:Uncharacterized protein n=1 Tax=Pyrenophora tritici-repentis TaxID=45151 RepID=A0A834RLY7_9PLEO|nr:hypothetical protein A1F99_118350 [Pyrenophora tritici-repentis]KAF7566516.1 hypothetical protein PtrM4_148360 [Pyrenophora tritici-repentis]